MKYWICPKLFLTTGGQKIPSKSCGIKYSWCQSQCLRVFDHMSCSLSYLDASIRPNKKVILEVFLVCCVCNFQTVKNVDDLSGARGCILILHPINPLNCFCHECLKRRMPLEGSVTVQKHSNLDARQKAFCWTAAVCSLWERWRPVTVTRDLQSLLMDLNHWLGCLSEYLAS